MKRLLLTGLATFLPLVLTIMLFTYLIDLFTAPFLNIVRDYLIEQRISHSPELITVLARIIILICLVVFTFLLGVFARWFFLRSFLKITNHILSKIPFVRKIYKGSKDIFEAFFSAKKGKSAFRHPILAPFPSKKSHSIAFVTGEVPKQCQEKIDEPLQSVFVPTAPHPISGYLIFVPEKDLGELEMTNEEAVKFTVSCGVIVPDEKKVQK